MRIIHTSDWHLGRVLHNADLLEDQAHALDELVALTKDVKPDAVIVAGDLFDRAIPPKEAVELADDVFTRIVKECGTTVIAIAGNHDSPERVQFGARILGAQGLHVAGTLEHVPTIQLIDKHGPVHIVALPYASPEAVRSALHDERIRDHESATAALIARFAPAAAAGQRRILVGHAFVDGGQASPDSERPLAVGGSGLVSLGVFDGFDYVALGHLHAPQSLAGHRVRYSGSLLKYSFQEAKQAKSISVVELDAKGSVRVEAIPLSLKRDLRIIEGSLEELLTMSGTDDRRDDWICARVLDEGLLFDPMAKLRTRYPNAIKLERPALAPTARGLSRPSIEKKSELDLFARFVSDVSGKELDAAERAIVEDAIGGISFTEHHV